MAADFLAINRSKQLGNLTVSVADRIAALMADLDKLNNAAGHSDDGTTRAMVETNFGLASGTGANFLTLLGNMNVIFNTNGTVAGQARLDQIREFVGRVSGQ